MQQLATRAAFAAISLPFLVIAHGDDKTMDMDMGMSMDMHAATNTSSSTLRISSNISHEGPTSYFIYGKHSGTIIAHIALMILGWCFVLPAGKRFSRQVFESRLTPDSGYA